MFLALYDTMARCCGRFRTPPTSRDDVISFFDQIAAQTHDVPRIVLLGNAAIHKSDAMQKKRRAWAKQGFHLYYLPPYSPELKRIEILWKNARYFGRRFTGLNRVGRGGWEHDPTRHDRYAIHYLEILLREK